MPDLSERQERMLRKGILTNEDGQNLEILTIRWLITVRKIMFG